MIERIFTRISTRSSTISSTNSYTTLGMRSRQGWRAICTFVWQLKYNTVSYLLSYRGDDLQLAAGSPGYGPEHSSLAACLTPTLAGAHHAGWGPGMQGERERRVRAKR